MKILNARVNRTRKRQRGFTLVELMVVVVILGTLIALVGPNIWNMLFQSNEAAAKAQMSNFGQAINNYLLTNKKLPSTLDELMETSGRNPHPYIDSVPDDPWGNPYDYRTLDRKTYQIRSNGEDALPDTEDDILYPDKEK
jgi:general secretion pathway protein G